jgi:hypothetical protein
MTWFWEPMTQELVVHFTPGSGLAQTWGRIEVGDTPDWSDLRFTTRHDSDDLGPTQVHESFAVRVECEHAGGAF